jgi:hypothetical protein
LSFSPVFLGRINGCSLLIPRQVFVDVGYFDSSYRVTQDYDYWHRLSNGGYRFLYVSAADTYSRVHPAQGTLIETCVVRECTDLHLRFLSSLTRAQLDELRALSICPHTVFHILGEERGLPQLSASVPSKSRLRYFYFKHLDRRWASDLSLVGFVRSPIYGVRLLWRHMVNRIQRGARVLSHLDVHF